MPFSYNYPQIITNYFMNGKKFTFLILLLLVGSLAWAQNTVKGVVKSADDGEALIGASVKVKGTARGVVTDVEGNFVLTDVPSNATLEISYTGFTTVSTRVSNRSFIEVLLELDATALDEVVVTTFGSAKRSSFTGAFNKIDNSGRRMAEFFAGLFRGFDVFTLQRRIFRHLCLTVAFHKRHIQCPAAGA